MMFLRYGFSLFRMSSFVEICMPRSTGGELIPINPEIEWTFHRLQRNHREAQVQMANELNNPIIQANEGEAMDEGNEILGNFLTSQVIQSQSSIVYLSFGQPKFQ
ncbi:Hypothetical predicted protein [Olea europaea subsp. europaea]|uniref:Uncharacterized protein n=1 Tax=Olea europaea subsp. europaea TaxID=158383 RepID=A0A8S0T9W7_OLEEU|nr:Hypothetical predicted protein [Olea europaea subsp. europaea]